MRYVAAFAAASLVLLSSQFSPVITAQNTPTFVDRIVAVTDAGASFGYSEGLIISDPTSPSRLLVCTMRQSSAEGFRVEARRSSDAGLTWDNVFISPKRAVDPACAWGADGTSYLLTLTAPDGTHHRLYRSTDGAATWSESGLITGQFDRPTIVVDTTENSFRNRLYIAGASIPQFTPKMVNAFSLFRSTDGGRTFLGPTEVLAAEDQAFEPGNSIVARDGIWYTPVAESLPTTDSPAVDRLSGGASLNMRLRVLSSKDGGETIESSPKVADFVAVRRLGLAGTDAYQMSTFGPEIATDPSTGPFGGRLYVVWIDAWRGLYASHSADRGRTWSTPTIVAATPPNGPAISLDRPSQPMLAVNRDGVVLVAWYDRSRSKGSLSYSLRLRLSHDGGETFGEVIEPSGAGAVFDGSERWVALPSARRVAASNSPTSAIEFNIYGNPKHLYAAGDFHFISADSLGQFHLYWIDNRHGLPQVWTARVTPSAHEESAGPLQSRQSDITSMVGVEAASSTYDQKSGQAALTLTITNTSTRTVKGPLTLRLVALNSDFGTPHLTNGPQTPLIAPMLVDVSAALPQSGILRPSERSNPVQLVFAISDASPRRRGTTFANSVISASARLFGGIEPDTSASHNPTERD